MASRKSFLLRMDPEVLEALRRWSDEELRSLNGHVEYLLRRALRDAGRMPTKKDPGTGKSAGKGERE